ncbi:hypothetical protein GF324_08965, partial [bacterium]|nr:hypothetical protein [bacterium]
MLRAGKIALLVILLAGLLSPAAAWRIDQESEGTYKGYTLTENVFVDGHFRVRQYIDDRDYNSDIGAYETMEMRAALGFRAMPHEDYVFRIKVQESRELGTTKSNSPSTSQATFHEAYVVGRNLFGTPLALQVGRFEMMYGDRRFIGNGAWNNYGPRTFDGFRLMMRNEDLYNMHFIYVKTRERGFSNVEFNQPYQYGANSEHSPFDEQMFGFMGWVYDHMFWPVMMFTWDQEHGSGTDADFYGTFGTYAENSYDSGIFWDLDAYYQFGTKANRDLASYLIGMDVGYAMKEMESKPKFQLGFEMSSASDVVDYTSGEEDASFYAPYRSKHYFAGWLDQFNSDTAPYRTYGLTDIHAKFNIKPGKLNLTVQWLMFMVGNDEAFVNADGENYSNLGQ